MDKKTLKTTENKQNNGICAEAAEASILKGSDDVLEQRLLHELACAREKKQSLQTAEPQVITEFSELSAERVFSENACYKLFNRDTKTEFFINGRALEGKIGLDSALYEKVKNRAVKAFTVGNWIVTFHRYCAPASSGLSCR